jgi:hypothetical protein
VANPRLSLPRLARLPLLLAYATTVAVFLWICAQFYLPGQGFTYLIIFGAKESPRYIPQLRALNHYELEGSPGYDAQYYAQIAMQPRLTDPALKDGVDNLAYRARRILFCWTAYGLALGDPARAMHIYAVQNIVCWLLLAALLLRWFPATQWGNFVRWFCVLFCFGLCFSVRGSLVDGPSLLLIAVGVALAEAGRPWWSAVVLGVSGLGKETNLLAGAALLRPAANTARGWLAVAGRGLVIVLPLALWLVVLWRWLGDIGGPGVRNFAAPFTAYVTKWQQLVHDPDAFAGLSVLMLVALTVQFLFFALRPRGRDAWWRVAAAYSVLMIFLGDAVWEGYPGAASRVLLPMTLAFNILVPRGWKWWLVLLLGNLTIFAAYDTLRAPGRESYRVEGPRELRLVGSNGRAVEAVFDGNWYAPERSRLEYWRWSNGPATLTLRNPHPFAIVATVSFGIRCKDARKVGLWQDHYARWERTLQSGEKRDVKVRDLRLEPGDTLWRFETDVPPSRPEGDDQRLMAFSLRDLKIEILGRADDLPPKPGR